MERLRRRLGTAAGFRYVSPRVVGIRDNSCTGIIQQIDYIALSICAA